MIEHARQRLCAESLCCGTRGGEGGRTGLKFDVINIENRFCHS